MLAVNWPISFEQPAWLWLLAAIPVLVAVSMRSLAGLDPVRRATALVMRSLVILALALALARIQLVKHNDHVALMFVLDRSRSIPDPLRLAAQEVVKNAAKNGDRDDRVGVIGFDGEADVDLIPSRAGFDIQDFGWPQEPDRTNPAAGLRLAMAAFPQGFARRIVLVTDGNQNAGDLKEEIETARANGVVVDVLPLQYEHDNEVLFDRITVPAQVSTDTKVPVRMVLKSRKSTKVQVSLWHNDQEVPLSENVFDLSGGMRPDPFVVPLELHGGGVHRFDARITPLDPKADSIPENNRATAFTNVEAQGGVLILTQANSNDDQVLFDALRRELRDPARPGESMVQMQSVDQYPIDLERLQQYSAVILSNIAADQFNEEQHRALATYVRHFGGGLIMTGGDQAFGAGGWIGKPIEEVSPVTFEVKHKKLLPRGALAIIMHSCEIPRGNYWGEQVAIAAIQTISSLDYIGVIDFSYGMGGPHWEVPLQLATDKPAIIRKVKQMQNGDAPSFEDFMTIVFRDMMKLSGVSQRHVIIISDGDPAAPTPATIKKYVDNKITVSTVGIGYGSHVVEQTLRKVANDTGGRFHACRNPKQLPQIFVKEAKVVKRPLIDDRPFQPNLLGSQVTLGIDRSELPPLGGLVLTTPKADISLAINRQGSEGLDPVLAHWNYEAGKMAVFTSGWWPKWGTDWAGWEKFGKFWAQLVRWAMRQKGSADFDIATRVDGNRGHITIEALDKDASYLNFLQIRGKLMTPGMTEQDLRMRQTGPGQYELDFPLHEHGNYHVYLTYTGPNDKQGSIHTGVSVPYSPEFRELSANVALLQEAAERTGGRVLDLSADVKKLFSRDLPPSVSRQPIWRWVVTWLLIPLFILDVAARRLASAVAMSFYVEVAMLATGCAAMYAGGGRWWGYLGVIVLAEMVGWGVRRKAIRPALAWITGSLHPRAAETSQQALSQLKGVREKVREDLTATQKARQQTIALEETARRDARFDVGDAQASRPAGDLTQAVGGADPAALAAEEQAKREAAAKARESGAAGGDIASRLRRAKQRAQDEIKERTEDPSS